MARNETGRNASAADRGFTLIEVLVALTILAVVLTPLFRIYSSGLRLSATGERYAKALVVAESVLAEAAATRPYVETDRSGETNDGFGWRLRVEPFEPDETTPPIYSFQSSVNWTEGRRSQSLALHTLRLDPKRKDGE